MASGDVLSAESPAKRVRLEMPTLNLNTGATMPVVGLGTFLSKPGEVSIAVKAALDCGYRHLDCASIYGNEDEVGEGFKASGVTREEVFFTSKLFNNDHAEADVEPACRATLSRLGIDCLDLYLVHWPVCLRKDAPLPPCKDDFVDVPMEETWRAMEALVEKGFCKAIGVSNFSVKKLEQLLSTAKVKPAVNQVEGHPWLQQPKLKEFCDAHGIVLTAYAPLGSPERPARLKDESDPVLLDDEVLAGIAKDAGRSPASVLLRWAVQRGTIVIPKSVTPARIEQNLKDALTPLPNEAMEALRNMDRHLRLFKGTLWIPEGTCGPIKTLADLWDD